MRVSGVREQGNVRLAFGTALPTFIAILTLAGCFNPGTAYKADMSGKKRWEIREFMISHWSFPKDQAQLEQFAEDGFNTVIAVPEELSYCRKHGFKALLAAPPEKAADYLDDPLVWGYFVLDEPGRKKIPYEDVASKVSAYHRLDPSRPAYVNLNKEDDLSAFISVVRPRVLSYDYYQWWEGQELFFPLLEKFRNASLEAGIPLICWVEAVVVPSGEIPADNAARIRQSVYCSLAYGVKGIQWWAWRPFNRDAGAINAELRNLGPILVTLRSIDVFHTPPVPNGARPVPEDHWVGSTTENMVVGVLKDPDGNDFIIAASRDHTSKLDLVLKFSCPVDAVHEFDRISGEWRVVPIESEDNVIIVERSLGKGDGTLLRVIGNKPAACARQILEKQVVSGLQGEAPQLQR